MPQVTQPLGDVSLARTDSEIRRILSQVKEKREAMPAAEIYRVYFNRQPSPDPDYAILSSLSQGRYPIDSRTKPDSRLQSAEYCKGCHQKEYNLWRESLHSRSFTNIRFQEAFEREPMAWCLNCHAPFWYDSKLHRAQPGPDIKLQEMYQSDRTVFVHQRKIPADSPYLYKDYYEYSSLRKRISAPDVMSSHFQLPMLRSFPIPTRRCSQR
ncbi:MAG: cytochrome c family protein [Spirochaetia bacterium]|nr:cytochrome c family protein [Spirochaetia bacterium]